MYGLELLDFGAVGAELVMGIRTVLESSVDDRSAGRDGLGLRSIKGAILRPS